MDFNEIIIETTTEGADFVADAFFSIGASGVKIIDYADVQDLLKNHDTWDYIDSSLLDSSDQPVLVSCFVSPLECESKLLSAKDILASITGVKLGSLNATVNEYRNFDCIAEWKKHFAPIEIGRFIVVPEWISLESNKIAIRIDPSMAFGTGEHESTRLCLECLSRYSASKKSVIDIGTGSGILGIAAAKDGASSVYMCDIDSLAIESSTKNAILNNVIDFVEIAESDLAKNTNICADMILANLTADLLISLIAVLETILLKKGILICSGIILTRRDEVVTSFTTQGYTLLDEITMGEWVCLALIKA
ncbi:MAG: 50S ribosomal protein L11 methyltransferase [Christensenellaceae bacterium]|nr:50S ribosomal protein L11 methyltransferase [Christensenellaceae bacterium]